MLDGQCIRLRASEGSSTCMHSDCAKQEGSLTNPAGAASSSALVLACVQGHLHRCGHLNFKEFAV